MRIEPLAMLPPVELEVFAWLEDAQEWMIQRDMNPLDLVDDSEAQSGHYIINNTDTPTCLLWFDVYPGSFNVVSFAGIASAASYQVIRDVYKPFFSASTPSDDVMCQLLADFTSAAVFGVGNAIYKALDVVHADLMPGVIPRDDPWIIHTDPPVQHVPSNYELIAIYQSWQLGAAPFYISERFGVDEQLIFSECENIRRFARSLGLRTV